MERRRRGFTLLEVLIALGLLGSALMAVAGAVDVAGGRVMRARELLQASRFANAKLQEVAAARDLADVTGAGSFEEDPRFTWEVEEEERAFELAELELAPETRRVRIRIDWEGNPRPVVLFLRRPLVRRGVR